MESVNAYELALIAGGFTVLGALVGGLIAYWLAIQFEAIKSAGAAKARFRASFAPTLAFIYIARHHGIHDRPDIDAHVKQALLSHGAAVEVFRRFVPSDSRKRYQQTWEAYRKSAAMGHEDRKHKEWETDIDAYEVLLETRIHELLTFADA